mgnify:CR=1 FL=1
MLTKIPAAIVPDAQKNLLRELDKDRVIQRGAGEARGDDALDPSEVKAALANLSSFSPDEQVTIKGWAQMLGVDAGNAGAPVKRAWQDREKMPSDRIIYDAVVVGGHVFADHGEQGYGAISRFDPAVNTWTEVPNPSQNLWHGNMGDATLASLGNSLVAMAGHDGQNVWPYAYRYDVDSKQWQQMPNIPTPRWGMGTAELDGKLYAMGGTTKSGYEEFAFSPLGQENAALSKACELYDPATNAWSKLPDLPVARAQAAAIAVDGKIYVVGGLEAGTSPRRRRMRRRPIASTCSIRRRARGRTRPTPCRRRSWARRCSCKTARSPSPAARTATAKRTSSWRRSIRRPARTASSRPSTSRTRAA